MITYNKADNLIYHDDSDQKYFPLTTWLKFDNCQAVRDRIQRFTQIIDVPVFVLLKGSFDVIRPLEKDPTNTTMTNLEIAPGAFVAAQQINGLFYITEQGHLFLLIPTSESEYMCAI